METSQGIHIYSYTCKPQYLVIVYKNNLYIIIHPEVIFQFWPLVVTKSIKIVNAVSFKVMSCFMVKNMVTIMSRSAPREGPFFSTTYFTLSMLVLEWKLYSRQIWILVYNQWESWYTCISIWHWEDKCVQNPTLHVTLLVGKVSSTCL